MSGWNEEVIRKAASWRSFKEGREMTQAGCVSKADQGVSGWSGVVKAGKRSHRVKVILRSVNDVEAHCSCPQNQSTGEFCAHAVAVGLHLLLHPSPETRPKGHESRSSTSSGQAFEIRFSTSWPRALRLAKLPLVLVKSNEEPVEADHLLANWLLGQAVSCRLPLRLNLSGDSLAEFLELAKEHPRIRSEHGDAAIRILDGARMPLEDSEPVGDRLLLRPQVQTDQPVLIGERYWQISDHQLRQFGLGPLPDSLISQWDKLIRGGDVSVEWKLLLNQMDVWQDWLAFPEQGWVRSIQFIPAEPEIEFALEGAGQILRLNPRVRYEDGPWLSLGQGALDTLPRMDGRRCLVRAWSLEQRLMDELKALGFCVEQADPGCWNLKGREALTSFALEVLPSWRERWSLREDQSWRSFCSSLKVLSPSIEIIGKGSDWLSFNLKFKTSDGNIISKAEAKSILGGFRSGSGHPSWNLNAHWKQVIEPLLSDLEVEQVEGHYEASLRSGEIIEEICNNYVKSNKTNYKEKLIKFPKSSGFVAELRPYQALGVAWIWDRMMRHGGALLADDMGLGKTVQTIAFVESLFGLNRPDSGVVLVVMTASLLGNWRQEWKRFAPDRTVHVMHGAQRDELRGEIASGDVVLTTYGTLVRDLAWHLRQNYRGVIADEASLMRNPDTDHAKALAKLKSGACLALTGTPLENGIRDLWSIFRFVQPGWLGGRKDFEGRYAGVLGGEAVPGELERLRLKLSPFLLRRTKEEVAPDLPAKWVIDEYCELAPEQQGIYRDLVLESRRRVEDLEDARQSGAARMQVLTALLRLRQVCGDLALLDGQKFGSWVPAKRSAKLVRLLELLEEAVSGGHRVLVFSQFQKQLLLIEEVVRERGWESLRLDGQTRNRQQLVDRFQAKDGPPLFLISLKAGGYGLNLTAADVVIHFDPWWNPAAEAQATDRAHRIGQTRPVTVYRLLTRGTVEEKVVGLQAQKRELATVVDETGEGDPSAWGSAELRELLTGT